MGHVVGGLCSGSVTGMGWWVAGTGLGPSGRLDEWVEGEASEEKVAGCAVEGGQDEDRGRW